ncbi:hypothetical protein ACEWY4_027558 [Coilia grayii]|uniref:Fibronectin type-III domain-containing protein n=1 Tax=Coilia grayii TaxID=363190 RepID=A0ABD1IPU3_9TELE
MNETALACPAMAKAPQEGAALSCSGGGGGGSHMEGGQEWRAVTVNVSVVSFNLEHTLTWSPGNNTPTDTHFRVQYSMNRSWVSVSGCQELVCGESCDLTVLLWDPFDSYGLRLQAFSPAHNHSSHWSHSKPFCPITDTVFGPPVLQVSGCGACLRLHIRPPASRWQQHNINNSLSIHTFYTKLMAHLTRTRDNAQFSVPVQSGENLIGYLEPGAEYCLTVVTVTHLTHGSRTIPSQPHCTHTSPTPANPVLVFVSVLCALSLMVALLFCAALLYSGLLLPTRTPLPHALSSVSSLTPPPHWMSGELPPELPLLDKHTTHTLTHTHTPTDAPHKHTPNHTAHTLTHMPLDGPHKHRTEDETTHTLTHTPDDAAHTLTNTQPETAHTLTHTQPKTAHTLKHTQPDTTHTHNFNSDQDTQEGYGSLT